MKVLVGQPIHEENAEQLEYHVCNSPNVDIIVYPEGYLVNGKAVETACAICKANNKILIAGYRKNGQNRVLIVDRKGERVLDREKANGMELQGPLAIDIDASRVGCLLCREIFVEPCGIIKNEHAIDILANPIDVGMYSEDQLAKWIGAARKIAKAYGTMVIGGSHADGAFKDYPVSIPIAYCIDKQGDILFIAKSDSRPRVVDLRTKSVQIT